MECEAAGARYSPTWTAHSILLLVGPLSFLLGFRSGVEPSSPASFAEWGGEAAFLANNSAALATSAPAFGLDAHVGQAGRRLEPAPAKPAAHSQGKGKQQECRKEPATKHFIRKTRFNHNVRFIFVAGLEGTGHHFWESAFERCGQAGGPCSFAARVQRLLYNSFGQALFNSEGGTASSYRRLQLTLVRELRDLQAAAEKKRVDLIALNLGEHLGLKVGEMSYPNYGGENKTLHRPDIRLLAELAEEAAIDLRILVLQRKSSQILRSTITHRHFEEPMTETAILTHNGFALSGQLALLDRRFFLCVDQYATDAEHDLRNRLDEIGGFLHPALENEHKRAWKAAMNMFTPPHELVTRSFPEDMAAMINRLSAANNLITLQCLRTV